MTVMPTIDELRALPVDDRLSMIEALWDSLNAESGAVSVPDWHRHEVAKRLAAFRAEPDAARPWADAKADILRALRS